MGKQLDLFTDKFIMTEVGLEVRGNPDFEEWMDYGQSLKVLDGTARQFAIGDWLNTGETFDPKQYGMGEELWGEVEKQTLRVYKYVSNRVLIRINKLSWSHHREVADVSPDKQRYWLERAAADRWSVATLRQKISEKIYLHLYKGDMIDIIPGLGKFDLVVTDPPYGIDYNGTWDNRDNYQPERWLKAIIPHLADEYNLFWFCSPSLSADMEFRFKAFGMPIQSRVVWHRRNMSMGSKATNKFIDSWEMILHVGNRELNFPAEWSDAWFDVQTFAVPQTNFTDKKMHPTQKPEGLIQRLIEFGSYPGDSILDPFAGSGTSGAVCPDDRDCTLIEMEEGYAGIAEARLGVKRVS